MTVSPRHAWHVRTEGPQLTAFDSRSGARLSFGPTPARLRAPELLDVKLTDVCSVGCAFCYQDSRPDRRHARLEDVALIAAEAGRSGVFEVALGGGEVSEYPHFHEALHLFRVAGVVPNFTTRRMRWLALEWSDLRELVGGVAVSVGSAAEVRLLNRLIPTTERRPGQLVAQVVMGTVERAELRVLLGEAGEAQIRVTLLGFKDVGRGQTFRPLPYDWWLNDLPDSVRHTPVSIDTALAAECPAELEKLLLPGSYHTEEGRFSAYVDAVSMTLAPSSYHAGPVYPFDADWLAHFATPDFVQGPPTPPAQGRVRLGFATNSSSSHSLVLLAHPEQLTEEEYGPEDWLEENFLLTRALTSEDKRSYLAAQLAFAAQDLFPDLTWPQRRSRILALCGLSPATPLTEHSTVDLLAALELRPNPAGTGPEHDQWAALLALFLQPDTAVYSGYDDTNTVLPDDTPHVRVAPIYGRSFEQLRLSEPAPAQDFDTRVLTVLEAIYGSRLRQVAAQLRAAGLAWRGMEKALWHEPGYSARGPEQAALVAIREVLGLQIDRAVIGEAAFLFARMEEPEYRKLEAVLPTDGTGEVALLAELVEAVVGSRELPRLFTARQVLNKAGRPDLAEQLGCSP